MTTFKQSMENRCANEYWTMIIILTNGITIEVNSEYIEFHSDFLEFDRIDADVEIPNVTNSGDIPRWVKIPYTAIAIFTDTSS